ncbi:hypothetical protein Poli38472_007927 [Pythium oligandrum]|uniref:Uncharacterized protein n=1 Tax=Pythium oligandrum TaxID=41045 RepID=A0A8K1CME4_PYTOL|nr:hypothetical protein Poli38472_007927 [Pythium oligandrum]|eukprot:TMW65285.1 hypothetical protein Poli38472_007927 [Pythium oligandrum]
MNEQEARPVAVHAVRDGEASATDSRLLFMKRVRNEHATAWQFAVWFYYWALWTILMGLLLSQFGGVVWNHSTRHQYVSMGKEPGTGLRELEELNDEPYVDRCIVCTLQNRQYKPISLKTALEADTTVVGGTSLGPAEHGYRVVRRKKEIQLSDNTFKRYSTTCDVIASTLDAIMASCRALGYDVIDDYLRIVDGVESSAEMKGLPDSLPVLIQPLEDNAETARYLIPGQDGSACVFRLEGKYFDASATVADIRGISRSVREKKAIEWLGKPGGTWRNGWYRDTGGTNWHVTLFSSKTDNIYGIPLRQFDALQNVGRDCVKTKCESWPLENSWGKSLRTVHTQQWVNSFTISNGTRYGVYWLEYSELRVVKSIYDLETFISNLSLGFVLLRWMICMFALQSGYYRGTTNWAAVGIGCLGCMRHFHLLALTLLPRLKTTIAAFWTVGCVFVGDQVAMSEAWFVVYPAIGEFVFHYYCLLNLLSKMLRRRVSDVMFGPTLIVLFLLHLFRYHFSNAGWFVHPDNPGALASIIQSSDFENLSTGSLLFSGKTQVEVNGGIQWLLTVKYVLIGLNVLPILLLSERTVTIRKRWTGRGDRRVESAMALRASNLAGFGRSTIYAFSHNGVPAAEEGAPDDEKHKEPPVLTSFELVRVGYIVFGGTYVMSINDWLLLLVLAWTRRMVQPPNFRLVVFTIQYDAEKNRRWLHVHPHFFRLNDPRIQHIDMLDVTAWPFH